MTTCLPVRVLDQCRDAESLSGLEDAFSYWDGDDSGDESEDERVMDVFEAMERGW